MVKSIFLIYEMKMIIIIFIIVFTGCTNTRFINNKDSIKNVTINLVLHDCVRNSSKDITFIIHNENNFGFWIRSWNLMLDSITNTIGQRITPIALIEFKAPNTPEYAWVNAMSDFKIVYSTYFFENFDLRSGVYNLFASYKNAIAKRHSKEITLLQPINIDKVSFVKCNQQETIN